MNNLHITGSEFRQASRIIKETKTIQSLDLFDSIFIAALHSPDQKIDEKIHEKVFLKRFILKSRSLNKALFSQLVKYREFYIELYNFYKDKDIKIINIHHLSMLPIGYILKRKFGAKLIYDAHELETETIGLSRNKFRKKLSELLERFFIYKCDAMIVVSESISQFYSKKYKILPPPVVYNAPFYYEQNKINRHFHEKFEIGDQTKVFLYQGGLSHGRGVEFLLEYFAQTKLDIVLVVMGSGNLLSKVKFYEETCSKIKFHEAVDPRVVLDYTSSTDFGFSLTENTCLNHDYCMPNKLFEYIMTERPVITSNLTEQKSIVIKEKIGLVMEQFSFNSLEDTIKGILKMEYNELQNNCRRVAKKYCWENQEVKIEQVFKGIM